MNKEQILEELQKRFSVSREEAEEMFLQARRRGDLRIRLNWKIIIDYLIWAMIAVSGLYALCNIIF